MREPKYVVPESEDEPQDVPQVRLVRDRLTNEDISPAVAVQRIYSHVKTIANIVPFMTIVAECADRFSLTLTEVFAAVATEVHAIRLRRAQKRAPVRASAILSGRTPTNADRDSLSDWLREKYPILDDEEVLSLVVTTMGDYVR